MTADTHLLAAPVVPAALARRSPLAGWAERFALLPEGLAAQEEPFGVQVVLRAGDQGADGRAAEQALGGLLPSAAATWSPAPAVGGAVLWLGPDEYLVTAPPDTDVEGPLRAAAAPAGGVVVDVSAQRTTLRLRGPLVADVLSGGCAVDLHPRAFRRGACLQTPLGPAGVVLLALDDAVTDVRVLVRSSFAVPLATWLLDAALEHVPAAAVPAYLAVMEELR